VTTDRKTRARRSLRGTRRRFAIGAIVALGFVAAFAMSAANPNPAGAAVTPDTTPITAPTITAPTITAPAAPTTAPAGATGAGKGSISIDLGGLAGNTGGTGKNSTSKPNSSVVIILLLTVLAIAPALMVMLTSFTRIVIVLSLTRNALGLAAIPPNQVVIGLSLFLSLFVMAPTLTQINDTALQPLMKGKLSYSQAYDKAQKPLRTFMLGQTRQSDLSLFTTAAREKPAKSRDKVQMTALVPAFVLSELKTAFIIGFVIFIPFLIIDLIVSSTLMSMGMFMLPPVLVSLPFKLLLFVMVDGWALIVRSLITSFHH
jgi:flagellar biosynthetic protein FliP